MFKFKPVWGLLSLTAITACQLNQPTTNGRFALAIQWPQSGFQTLAIPVETENMQIVVRDQQTIVINERISRGQETRPRRQYTLSTGTKTVEIQALDANGKVVASSDAEVTIIAGQTTRAEMILNPVAQASPAPTANPGNSNGSGPSGTPNNPDDPASSPSGPPSQASPNPQGSPGPSSSSAPNPSASVSTGSNSGGGSSGGGSSNTGQAPILTGLSADPNPLPGGGFTAQITSTVSDPSLVLQASHYKWTCLDVANQACTAPQLSPQDPNIAYWQAPTSANNGPYILTLTLDTNAHPTSQQSVTVSVMQGEQNVSVNDSNFGTGAQQQ